MRLSISPTPSNTPSNTPQVTPTPSACPISCMEIGTGFNNTVFSMLTQAGGRNIIGGSFTQYSGVTANKIIAINSNGSIDNSFNAGTGISGSTAIVRAITAQSDGKILIGGTLTTNYDGNVTKGIFRVNSDGSFDNTFAPANFGAPPVFFTIEIDSSGKIYAGGTFAVYSGSSQQGLIRFNSDGSKDNTFNIGAGFTGLPVQGTIPQSDGKVLVVGQFTQYSGISANRIIRLNNDGTKDNTFNYGTGFNANVLAAVRQSDGKYVVVGTFTSYSGQTVGRIIRLNSDGSIDNTFDSSVGFPSGVADNVIIQSDGKIVVGGSFLFYSGQTAQRIVRLNTDGTIDNTFNTGAGLSSAVNDVRQLSDGKLLVGGQFTSYDNTIIANRIIKLDTNGASNMCSGLLYVQFTVTSGTTAEEACSGITSFSIYTQPFDDSACSGDLNGWACMPQGTQGAFLDPEQTIEIPNGFYACEFQTGVIGVYEYNGAFGNWSICGGATPTPTPTLTPTPSSTGIITTPSITPTNTLTPTITPTNTLTPTNTSTPTPTPTNAVVDYDIYLADQYECTGCTVSSSNVLVAFPQGQSVTIGNWYPDVTDTAHTYKILSTSTGAGYILTNIYGSFTSCAGACAV